MRRGGGEGVGRRGVVRVVRSRKSVRRGVVKRVVRRCGEEVW